MLIISPIQILVKIGMYFQIASYSKATGYLGVNLMRPKLIFPLKGGRNLTVLMHAVYRNLYKVNIGTSIGYRKIFNIELKHG